MALRPFRVGIIPLREIIGNYNLHSYPSSAPIIIPLREIIGNYNPSSSRRVIIRNYTFERDNRELQRLQLIL